MHCPSMHVQLRQLHVLAGVRTWQSLAALRRAPSAELSTNLVIRSRCLLYRLTR